MNKRQLEAAERNMLKHILDTNPKYKETMDALINNPHPELVDAVAPVVQAKLHEANQNGILAGWYAFAISAVKKLEKAPSLEEAIAYFQSEADKARKKLGLEEVPDFEDIVDEDNKEKKV